MGGGRRRLTCPVHDHTTSTRQKFNHSMSERIGGVKMRSALMRRGAAAGVLALATFVPQPSATSATTGPVVVSHDGTGYRATDTGTGVSYTGSLKSVVEKAVVDLDMSGGGTIEFTAGDFDLGSDWLNLHDVDGVTFAGAGMDATTIRNNNSEAKDTEPFDFTGAFGVTVRDMTVNAGGALRSTSDALDFDNGNDVLVQNVKVTGSRGRGIVFDGKNAGWGSARNHVAGCVITGVPSDGIELLASTDNVVEGCAISDVGGHGIQLAKSSPTADQPNKLPSGNTIRANTIDEAGADGVNVNGGNANLISGNTITNSSDTATGRDGIRVSTSDSVAGCDDNQVRGNTATDNQATKTQRYGLAVASALCDRTVIGADNDFSGNRVGAILDQGTDTVFEGGAPPVNHPPVAGDLSITATAGTPTTWTPVVSDPDAGTTLRCQLLQQPTQGTASVRTDCASGTYNPAAGANGSDSFVYRVTDGSLADTATVSVTIAPQTPTNQAPVAGDMSITATAGSATAWTPAVSDADGDALTCTITTQGAQGTASLTTDCVSGSYAPAAGTSGTDSFVYTVTDGSASDTGTVSVTIEPAGPPPNQPPVAGDLTLTTREGTAKTWTPVVSDPDGNPLTCTITTQGSKGTASVKTDCGSGQYVPASGVTGADSFVYTVSDGTASDTGTVSVTIKAVKPRLRGRQS